MQFCLDPIYAKDSQKKYNKIKIYIYIHINIYFMQFGNPCNLKIALCNLESRKCIPISRLHKMCMCSLENDFVYRCVHAYLHLMSGMKYAA